MLNSIFDQNSTKECIRNIWAEVLKLPAIEIEDADNFFLLGGDSLVMAQVMVRLQERFQFKFILSDLFGLSSINKMSQYCDEQMSRQAYPASAAQCGLWYIEQVEPLALYNTCVEINFNGNLNVEALQNSINALIRKHNTLRSSFHFNWKTGELLVKEDFQEELSISVQTIPAEELDTFSESFYQQKFNLEKGSLFQICLRQEDINQHTLMLCIHHIITDAWSGGIFLHELENNYKGFVGARENKVNALSAQYREYCEEQNYYLQSNDFHQQLLFWKNALKDINLNKPLLGRKCNATRLTFNSDLISFDLNHQQLNALSALAIAEGASLFMLNLTVFNTVLALNSGVEDISLGVPVANRQSLKFEGVIGYFVNLIVLRNTVDLAKPFNERLKEIKRSTLRALQNQDIPFQELVKALAVNDSENENPFFDIMFAYQNSPSLNTDFPELKVSIHQPKSKRCHYGLKLEITEDAESLKFSFEYATEIYERNTVAKLAKDFQLLLSEIITLT